MKTHNFHDGQKLTHLYFPDGEDIMASGTLTITVIMEDGQSGLAPWALVESNSGVTKWNLALVLGVELEVSQ